MDMNKHFVWAAWAEYYAAIADADNAAIYATRLQLQGEDEKLIARAESETLKLDSVVDQARCKAVALSAAHYPLAKAVAPPALRAPDYKPDYKRDVYEQMTGQPMPMRATGTDC